MKKIQLNYTVVEILDSQPARKKQWTTLSKCLCPCHTATEHKLNTSTYAAEMGHTPPLIVYSAQFATRPADIYVTNVFADFWQTIAPL